MWGGWEGLHSPLLLLVATSESAVPLVDEEFAVAAFETRQLGLPCRLVCRATLPDRAFRVKRPYNPPGAGKIAVGSDSFFKSSSFGASASIGTPL
jgi:hypothetical protein